MPPKLRERFNSKARGSTAGGSSHKKRKRTVKYDDNGAGSTGNRDDEMDIVVPKTIEEKQLERIEREKAKMIAEANKPMSQKKKKKLEGYIAKKLKKEDRVELMEKIAQSQSQIPSTLLLPSSALGSRLPLTATEKKAREEDRTVRKALEKAAKKRKLEGLPSDASESESDDGDDESEYNKAGPSSPPSQRVAFASALKKEEPAPATKPAPPPPAFASALKGGIKSVPWNSALKNAKGKERMVESDSESPSEDEEDESDESDDEEEDDDGQDSDEGSDEEEEDDMAPPKKKRSLGFRAAIEAQIAAIQASDESLTQPPTESSSASPIIPTPAPLRPKQPLSDHKVGPLGVALSTGSLHLFPKSSNPLNKVSVARDPEIQEARLNLPVVQQEGEIMELILQHRVVIICGETGSGKTTQVPQFLYESGFGTKGSDNPGMIGVTQPRRVAAMSMSARVASELKLPSSKVSYQIRYDATTSSSTSIKFMTDGVLLREAATDFLLTKYSVVIIDEAHERSLNTDVLVGVLVRIAKVREERFLRGEGHPLRIIIMSATLRVTDFSENTTLFAKPPPVITISTRQHPVTNHFSRRTSPDYLAATYSKVCKIHSRLPDGGVLIFLTGQNEIISLCKKLEKKFSEKAIKERKLQRAKQLEMRGFGGGAWRNEAKQAAAAANSESIIDGPNMVVLAKDADVEVEDSNLFGIEEQELAADRDDGAEVDPEDLSDSESEDDQEDDVVINLDEEAEQPMHILPLYSLLPNEKQMRVFKEPPIGSRLVVVATNVAETSLTIPGIKYVIDCGRVKERKYDAQSGIESFQVSWISKASASQRAGRAGRTGPGHCYKLYSSPVYENYFEQFSQPEILRMPIDGIVLHLKAMNIDTVINFPFPTPPDRIRLQKAEKMLIHLGAIHPPEPPGMVKGVEKKGSKGGQITELGRKMSFFPVSPRFSKMIVIAGQPNKQDSITSSKGCLPYLIAGIAALVVGDPFLRKEALGLRDDEEESTDPDVEQTPEMVLLRSQELRQKEELRLKKKSFYQSQAIHTALGGGASDVFRMLSVVGAYEYDGNYERFCAKNFVQPKAMQEIHKLRAQITSIANVNLPECGAQFVPKMAPPTEKQLQFIRQLLAWTFIDQIAIRKDVVDPSSGGVRYSSAQGVPYRAMGVIEDVFIHPSSALYGSAPPEYVVYHEAPVQTTNRSGRATTWLKTLTKINPAWLPTLGKQFITFSKPLSLPASHSALAKSTEGKGKKDAKPRQIDFVTPRFSLSGSEVVELPLVKRVGELVGGRWVFKVVSNTDV